MGPRAVDHGTVQNGPPPIVVQGASFEPASSPESIGTAGTTIRVLLEQMARTFKNGPMGPWTADRGTTGPSKTVPLRSWSKGSHSNRHRLLSRLGPPGPRSDAFWTTWPALLKTVPWGRGTVQNGPPPDRGPRGLIRT
ncbi:hypothetical protein MferCBS31731_007980, partial [Microsporum ferrugineum]